jgi:protein gp37
LDWLLLTKRPQNIRKMLPHGWVYPNIWIGTTTENQEEYNRRYLGHLYDMPCITFVSYEPALGPLTLPSCGYKPDWVICGGESGHGARYMDPKWARDLRDECQRKGVAFFFKQMTGKAEIPADLMVRQFPKVALTS